MTGKFSYGTQDGMVYRMFKFSVISKSLWFQDFDSPHSVLQWQFK